MFVKKKNKAWYRTCEKVKYFNHNFESDTITTKFVAITINQGWAMAQQDEYNETMIAALDLIWGEGFMAPGGEGNIDNLVSGLDLKGKQVLDIGCGQGRPACIIAEKYGAHVVGTDLEEHLVERSKQRAAKQGLSAQTEFYKVEPGPLNFSNHSFDLIVSSGAFTQISDKLAMYQECLRVLKPSGILSCYDWMKTAGPYSDDMLYWFELEGLTYAMETKEKHAELFKKAGFSHSELRDKSSWYRQKVREEYGQVKNERYSEILSLIGKDETDHFVEDWRVTAKVCEKGEMLQVYSRAYK
jgi:ubiquinone/menaquinone biosynthesis C-methylase UbiE